MKDQKKSGAKPSGLVLGMCLGIAMGTAVGASTQNMGLWIPIGLCMGLCFGLAMDQGAETHSAGERKEDDPENEE